MSCNTPFNFYRTPNVRYQSALEKLGKAELQCMLLALDVFTEPRVESIGGTPFLTFECSALNEKALEQLSFLSSVYLWTRRDGEALIPWRGPGNVICLKKWRKC